MTRAANQSPHLLCRLRAYSVCAVAITGNTPGPKPVFTQRTEVRLRRDQSQTLHRLSEALGINRSDLIRMILDNGIEAATNAHVNATKEVSG